MLIKAAVTDFVRSLILLSPDRLLVLPLPTVVIMFIVVSNLACTLQFYLLFHFAAVLVTKDVLGFENQLLRAPFSQRWFGKTAALVICPLGKRSYFLSW